MAVVGVIGVGGQLPVDPDVGTDVDDGFVVLGGPLGDDRRVLLVVEADAEDAVAARLAADPWWSMGLLRLVDIQPWQILLGTPA